MTSFDPQSYAGLDRLGRISLSKNFHFREFLYSEIAVHHGIRNVPEKDRISDAVFAGSKLCELLLEPLQEKFGRIHIRSGYRSRAVNAAGVGKHNCSADNDGFHTWDFPSVASGAGATACISIPVVSKVILSGQASYESLAWWIFDNLPDLGHLEFFATAEHSDEVCFNIGWSQQPLKSITSWRGGQRSLLKSMPSDAERTTLIQSLLTACGTQVSAEQGVTYV